jgi:hypothetical protein
MSRYEKSPREIETNHFSVALNVVCPVDISGALKLYSFNGRRLGNVPSY